MDPLSFGLAIPGPAQQLCELAQVLYRKIKDAANAPQNIAELREFLKDTFQGSLKTDLELAEAVLLSRDLDPDLKQALSNHLGRLQSELKTADALFAELYCEHGHLRRRVPLLEFFGRIDVNKVMDNLRKWQNAFRESISLVSMKKQLVPSKLLLKRKTFMPIIQDDEKYCSQLEPGSHIWLGNAEVHGSAGGIQEIKFMMERLETRGTTYASETKEMAADIALDLVGVPSPNSGILKCLGYRENEHNTIELVFEIPHELEKPITLRNIIAREPRKGQRNDHFLKDRLILSGRISAAVISIQKAQLHHKNIRPDTILMMRPKPPTDETVGLGIPFLTNWKKVRRLGDLSSRVGEDDWMANIYRHPKRQGLHTEERYNMRHDIYSLGICLLEIGLWEPLIVDSPDGCGKFICEKYRKLAVELGHVQAEEANDIRRLTWPGWIQEIMKEMSKQMLPQYVDNGFMELVIECLSCVEDGFGEPKADDATVCQKFNSIIQGYFSGSKP